MSSTGYICYHKLNNSITMQNREQVLIYDMQSQNNEQPQPTHDEPQPIDQHQRSTSHSQLYTKTIKVRSQQSEDSPEKNQNQIPMIKREKERKKSENIIFYEEELMKSTNSLDYDDTNRGFLKKRRASESDQDEQEDEIQELEQLRQEEEGDMTEQKKKIVPTQTTLASKDVLVTANVDLLVNQPVPLNYRLKCYLTIERGILGFAQTYRLFLGDQRQFLMSAKKENFKYYSNFLISKHPHEIHRRSDDWIGRLEANFLGTQFKYYSVKEKFQTLKLTASYDKNFVGFMGPRNFTVVKVNPQAKKSKYMNSLSSILQRNERSKLIMMETAKAELIRGKYRLDFGGKVRVPSSKNFILRNKDTQALLFGKINQDTYIMEISYPLSPFQAFGICLTSLDSKLMVS